MTSPSNNAEQDGSAVAAALAALQVVEAILAATAEGLSGLEAHALVHTIREALEPRKISFLKVESDAVVPGRESDLNEQVRNVLVPLFGSKAPCFSFSTPEPLVQPPFPFSVFDGTGVSADLRVAQYGMECYIAGQVSSPLVSDAENQDWQLVPRKATLEMMEGAFDGISLSASHTHYGVTEHVWAHLLANAPAPPAEVLITVPPLSQEGLQTPQYLLTGTQVRQVTSALEGYPYQDKHFAQEIEPSLKVLRGLRLNSSDGLGDGSRTHAAL